MISQTWLSSQLAQILQYRIDFNNWAILNQIWIKLDTNLFEFHKTYIHSNHLLKVISWIYPTQINPNLITKQLSIQTSHSKQHCIFIQFNQLICTQMKWSTRDIPWLAHDHPTRQASTQLFASHQIYPMNHQQLEIFTCML